jgi:hypothetical protein
MTNVEVLFATLIQSTHFALGFLCPLSPQLRARSID